MSKGTILVVEDHADARKLLCTMLKSIGFDVLDFPGGTECLAGIKGKKFKLAMFDIMMPDMNGFELMQKFKAIAEYSSVPVVMVTAKDSDTDVLDGYQHGADYYITKPYTTDQIKYAISMFAK